MSDDERRAPPPPHEKKFGLKTLAGVLVATGPLAALRRMRDELAPEDGSSWARVVRLPVKKRRR